MSANFFASDALVGAVSMGICKAVYSSGDTSRTITQLGGDLTVTGMDSITKMYKNSLDIGATISKGDGLMFGCKKTLPVTMATYYLYGFNLQILCRKL
jgi:hypothetical protein